MQILDVRVHLGTAELCVVAEREVPHSTFLIPHSIFSNLVILLCDDVHRVSHSVFRVSVFSICFKSSALDGIMDRVHLGPSWNARFGFV